MKKKKNNIKSTKHAIKFANHGKRDLYLLFLREYRRVAKIYFDYLWDSGWEDQKIFFNISEDQLNIPKFIDRKLKEKLGLDTSLSARALSSCLIQVLGCVRSVTEQRRRQTYVLNKLKLEGKDYANLQRKIEKKISKPNISNINPELSTKCCDFQHRDGLFNGFIQLHSIGKFFGKIRIPIKFTEISNKWELKGKMKTSFLFSKNAISIRWEVEKNDVKQDGIVLGADQGLKDVLTFSDGMKTPKVNGHGYSLEKITKTLARKKKGSKSFRKAQDHRKNFINWSINQLNFNNIKEIRFEKVQNIGYKKKRSRYLSHWTNTLIRDKLLSICEELKVLVVQQSATYRSQRCSNCGLVRKANRKGKNFKCLCGFICDADLNSANNHLQKLPDIPTNLRKLRKNLGKGFYWKSTGFFELTGEEIRVPLSIK